ncbi:hypothetical protein Sjap_008170 [Stephania japonica]|uniref:Uncharacterized protein n=1 Tax=Stephania japonica TaxID=461633 RepID=A0AAP0PE77_9MAGN
MLMDLVSNALYKIKKSIKSLCPLFLSLAFGLLHEKPMTSQTALLTCFRTA